jgi:predicted Ser/Thr protein kinase
MDELEPARALLPGCRLEVVERLRGGDRSVVHRVRADLPNGTRKDLVVKEFRTAGEGWVREAAALECVAGSGAAPRLVAAGGEPPVLVVEYLGGGGSLADVLLGDDPTVAADALRRWAEAVAALHVATAGARQQFRAALAAREGDLPVADTHAALAIEEMIRQLDEECAALGVAVPTGSFDALRTLEHRLGGAGPAALTPSDTCPDNNVIVGHRLVLLDFEDAQWRHIAWDVAYLRVPWPSCWCSWALPDDVADAAVAAYRAAAAPRFPEVRDEQFARDVEAAAVAWTFMSTMWFLPSIRAGDPPVDPSRPAPSRRAVVQHRLARTAQRAEFAQLAPLGELAERLRAELAVQYGAPPLEAAPAFRPPAGGPTK